KWALSGRESRSPRQFQRSAGHGRSGHFGARHGDVSVRDEPRTTGPDQRFTEPGALSSPASVDLPTSSLAAFLVEPSETDSTYRRPVLGARGTLRDRTRPDQASMDEKVRKVRTNLDLVTDRGRRRCRSRANQIRRETSYGAMTVGAALIGAASRTGRRPLEAT